MVRNVITLPLRIGAHATSLGFRIAGQAAGAGLGVAERLFERRFDDAPEEEPAGTPVDVVVPPPPPEPVAEPATPVVEPEPEPAHVSEEPELVESFADPGAENGAGATVHVAEPWHGYGHMTADDIVARLAASSREELAAVELYERLGRGRRKVLAAAERELRRATPPGGA